MLDRFKNPFIDHYLSSIALNSVSKFKVRVLPNIKSYIEKFGKAPDCLVFSLAALILLYRTDMANDNDDVVKFMKTAPVDEILKNTALWDEDLSYLLPKVTGYIESIEANGIRETLGEVL